MFNFVFDRKNHDRPYPNLAPMMDNPHDSYHGMGDTYPFIAPCRLIYYSKDHQFPCEISYTDQPIPDQAWYPVGLAFFDFSIDYFALISDHVKNLLRSGAMRVLFYYHEGDNPWHEKQHLDSLCVQHDLATTCYKFVSGNTIANTVPGFVWFCDHELFYWRNSVLWNNRAMPGVCYHGRRRGHTYTVLNRLHKWWRATVMTQLQQHGLLTDAYWSYNNMPGNDQWQDNPIMLSKFAGLEHAVKLFAQHPSVQCDQFDLEQQNNHWRLVPEHFDDAYCHVVLETLYDAEQSGGAFLTEKTFKPLRHAQPLIVFGTANTLGTLRGLGYQTFDQQLDNSYDAELDNTKRFQKTLNTLIRLDSQDLHDFYVSCRDQIIHNQQLFLDSKHNRLAELCKTLNNNW